MIDVSMLYLIIPLIVGLATGYFLQERKRVNLDKATVGVIVVLIFALGFSIGSNSTLLQSLLSVGLGSLLIASLTVTLSVLFVAAVRRKVKLK